MLDQIAGGVYHRYGFDALESSAVETVEALGKFLPDVDRPNEGVFAWQEADDEKWLALRYDLTAPPLARVYAQHRNDLPTPPYRRFAWGGPCGVMKSRGGRGGGFASFISVMRIRSARPRWPRMPKSARCWRILWRPWAFPPAATT